ncbi:MAG: aldo/keto reductase family oxidoreductase [Fimbriimonadaceae bacterium]
MDKVRIGQTGFHASKLAYGCMRIAGTWSPNDIDANKREAAHRAILAAYEAGYTLFDHADIYCAGACEALYGEVLDQVPAMRRECLVATKCGIRWQGDPDPDAPHRYDFSREHILWSCEQSLRRLRVETIDIYQLHRPDVLMDPDEVAEAFLQLHASGKVRAFGVSNFPPSMVSALQSSLPFPLVVNQVEIHPGRLDCFVDGTLDQCLEMGITPLAWSPVGGGLFAEGGAVRPDDPRREGLEKLLAELDRLAQKHGVTRTEATLAWLMRHPSQIVPIVGSTRPERIRQAAKAAEIEVSREDWYRVYVAARMRPLP